MNFLNQNKPSFLRKGSLQEVLGFVACVLSPALTCGVESNYGDLVNLTMLSVGI